MRKVEQAFLNAVTAAIDNPALIELARVCGENLMHARDILHNAGAEFERRVRETLQADLARAEARLHAMEKDVADIKESQVKIAGAFRGRNLPG